MCHGRFSVDRLPHSSCDWPMSYVEQIKNEFVKRKNSKKNYSLRAFARDLRVEASTLSKVIKGSRKLPLSLVDQVCQGLSLSLKDKELFYSSVIGDKGIRNTRFITTNLYHTLKGNSSFVVISEWEHYCFLNLLKLNNFQHDLRWAAKKMRILPSRLETVIENLKKADLLIVTSEGRFVRKYSNISSGDEFQSLALKVAHQNDLKIAVQRIWETEVEERDYASMVMAINSKKIKLAKKITRRYFEEMSSLLESENADEVFQLSVQLFPLTKGEKNGK